MGPSVAVGPQADPWGQDAADLVQEACSAVVDPLAVPYWLLGVEHGAVLVVRGADLVPGVHAGVLVVHVGVPVGHVGAPVVGLWVELQAPGEVAEGPDQGHPDLYHSHSWCSGSLNLHWKIY